jgi:hypothetical protein
MPVKRRLPKGRPHAITDDAVAAFESGEWMELHRALGLRPWEASPLDAYRATPPEWMTSDERIADWAQAWAWRQELERRCASANEGDGEPYREARSAHCGRDGAAG